MQIFISYRHSEALAATARLLHEHLIEQLDEAEVFLDSDGLLMGERFPEVLQARLAGCRVFLALIDPDWIASAARLQDSRDWVRRELEVALKRRRDDGIEVIPVLAHGASMPAAELLPPALAPLGGLLATRLHIDSLDTDIAALAQGLRGWTIRRLLLWLQARRRAALWAALGSTLLFVSSLVAVLDPLDARLEALTLAWSEIWYDQPLDARLVLVPITDNTRKLIGKDWGRDWREQHAWLITRLAAAGAEVVAFDMNLTVATDHDPALAAAVVAARASGTSVVFGPSRDQALPALKDSARWGMLCMGTQFGWARLAPLAAWQAPTQPGKALPRIEHAALGALIAWPDQRLHSVDPDLRQISLQALSAQRDSAPPLHFTRTEQLVDSQSCAPLAPQTWVALSTLRLSPLERLRDTPQRHLYEALCCGAIAPPPGSFSGKRVLVGSEIDANDKARRVWRGLWPEDRFGYELHADMANNLLQGVTLQALQPLANGLLTIALGLLGVAGRFWPRLWAPPWRGRLFAAAVPAAYLGLSVLCAHFNLLLNGAYHLAAFAFGCWVSGRLLRRRGLLPTQG